MIDKYIKFLNKETGYNWNNHRVGKLMITIDGDDNYETDLQKILKNKNIPYRIILVNNRSNRKTIGVDIEDIIQHFRDYTIEQLLK